MGALDGAPHLRREQPLLAIDAGRQQPSLAGGDGGVELGDRVQLVRFQKSSLDLKVVGIAAQPPLGGNPQGYMTIAGLQKASGQTGQLSGVSIIAREGDSSRLEEIATKRKTELPNDVLLQTSQKVTSGLNKNLETNQLAFIIVSMLSFLAASLIIMTGMSTGVTERLRELGVLRCIGASRLQLAGTQLLTGVLLGVGGAAIGVPLGLAGAAMMVFYFQEDLGAGLKVEAWRLAFAFASTGAANTCARSKVITTPARRM